MRLVHPSLGCGGMLLNSVPSIGASNAFRLAYADESLTRFSSTGKTLFLPWEQMSHVGIGFSERGDFLKLGFPRRRHSKRRFKLVQ